MDPHPQTLIPERSRHNKISKRWEEGPLKRQQECIAQRCSVCDSAKNISPIKVLLHLLFSNPTHKTKIGIANRWETTNTNRPRPIELCSQSTARVRLCCVFCRPQQTVQGCFLLSFQSTTGVSRALPCLLLASALRARRLFDFPSCDSKFLFCLNCFICVH
jgi:hypothetical protein